MSQNLSNAIAVIGIDIGIGISRCVGRADKTIRSLKLRLFVSDINFQVLITKTHVFRSQISHEIIANFLRRGYNYLKSVTRRKRQRTRRCQYATSSQRSSHGKPDICVSIRGRVQ